MQKKINVIFDIIFDRNPKTQEFMYDGKSTNLIKYYKTAHGLKIKDASQPLILVIRKGPQDQQVNLYFIPELCYLAGL